jgi:hypothetical protein
MSSYSESRCTPTTCPLRVRPPSPSIAAKKFLRVGYRGLASHLADHPDLIRLIGRKSCPTSPRFTIRLAAYCRRFQAGGCSMSYGQVARNRVRERRVPGHRSAARANQFGFPPNIVAYAVMRELSRYN